MNRAQQNATFLEAMVSQQAQEQQRQESPAGSSVDERHSQLKALLRKKQEFGESLHS